MQDAHASQAPEVHIGGTFMQLASGAVAQYANGKHAWHWLGHWEQSSGCGEGGVMVVEAASLVVVDQCRPARVTSTGHADRRGIRAVRVLKGGRSTQWKARLALARALGAVGRQG